jgi:hypothetical protein
MLMEVGCGGSVNGRRRCALRALLATFATSLVLLAVGCDSTGESPGKSDRKGAVDSGSAMDAAGSGGGADAGSKGTGGSAADAGSGGGGGGAMEAGSGGDGGSATDAGTMDGGGGGNAGDASGTPDVSVEPVTLIDPVSGSQVDATLDGTDADGNGVRDDLDAYIATLETDPTRVTALVSFARESTKMMLLGGAPSATKRAAVAQAQRVGRTIDCLHDLYAGDLTTKQEILRNVRSALYDNGMRLTAYNHASTLVSGTLFRTGHGCDFAITGVSP